MKEGLNIDFNTRVLITEHNIDEIHSEGDVLLDKSNAIHSQNMARAISRALSREPNSFIHRIAFGNGGSFTDAGETTIINLPNDGTRGDGWESRLYNETYSEIIDENNILVGTDPGSSGPNSTRIGGGSVPSEDPEGTGVISLEVGRKSNIIATMFLNKSEPISQLSQGTIDTEIIAEEKSFEFDELGFYTTGQPASPAPASSVIDVGNKTSEDPIPTSMLGSQLSLSYEINGNEKQTVFIIPNIGSGPQGEVTFGDLAEGINTGSWFSNSPGDDSTTLIKVTITDRTPGAVYPTIAGSETFGFLVFESLTAGAGNTLKLNCNSIGSDILFNLTGNCAKIDASINTGVDAGVANDAENPQNERERLLTHLTFSPILKKENRVLKIVYTLTVSVSQTGDCVPNIENNIPPISPTPTPSVSDSATPTPTPSVSESATPTPTPSVSESATPTPTPSVSESATPTPTPTPSMGVISESATPTPTPSMVGVISESATPTPTPSVSESATPTPTPSVSESATPTPTPSVSESATPTPTPSVSESVVGGTWTPADISGSIWFDTTEQNFRTDDGTNLTQLQDVNGGSFTFGASSGVALVNDSTVGDVAEFSTGTPMSGNFDNGFDVGAIDGSYYDWAVFCQRMHLILVRYGLMPPYLGTTVLDGTT